MLHFGRAIAKARYLIVAIAFLLLIPSVIGYMKTKVNYDILYYLPDNIETMKGQDILLNDFGKGAYAIFIVNGMNNSDVAKLKEKVEDVDHVSQVIWYDSFMSNTVPQEMLPEKYYNIFHSKKGTMMAIFFDQGTSSSGTMDAITQIRKISGDQCFLSSMSAIVVDTKNLTNQELFWYVLIAVILSAIVLAVTMDSFMAPILFLLTIGIAIVYNLGTNLVTGEISFITMSLAAVLQLAVTMDYSIFLWNSYKEEKEEFAGNNKEAMAHAISKTIVSIAGSSLTTIAGFVSLCFMQFTLGLDLGVVMAKGVVIGVVICVTVLPALMLILDRFIVKTSHRALSINGAKIARFIVKHRRGLMVGLLVLWIPAIIGYKNIKVYYDLASSLPDYLPSIQANKELESDYDTNSIMMVLADDKLSAKTVRNMVSDIENVKGIEFAVAADSVIPESVPTDFVSNDEIDKLKGGGYQLMMISSKYKVASNDINSQITTINNIIDKYDTKAMLIGEAPCTKDLITITNHDFQVVNVISIGLIFLLILFVLKSISLPVILVLVIELAIYINMSISFYTGVTLPFIASIVISTIQLGATVDYGILMTNRYLSERVSGNDKMRATTNALSACAPSIITSGLCFFAATIGVAIYSDVDLIGSLCMLIARGALISMALVILLLPALYMLFDSLIMKTSFGLKRYQKRNETLEQAKKELAQQNDSTDQSV